MAEKEKKEKKGIVKEFKEFIYRGNVLDMAVGVIIGAAFNAIVTSVVNILLSLCTWRIPGGIKGLITVLPAANDIQRGMNEAIGLGQYFEASQLQELATKMAVNTYGQDVVTANPNLIESIKSTITSNYTLHGAKYVYNLSSSIDWGAFINAVISFLIIAVTLFVVIKTANKMREKREELNAKIQAKKDDKEPKENAEAEANA